ERRALPAGPDRRGAEGLAARHRMVRADRQRRARGPRAPARRERDRQAGKARRGARLPEARGRGQPRPGSAAGRGRGAAAARGEPQPRRLRAARPGAQEGSRAARPALRHGADRREARAHLAGVDQVSAGKRHAAEDDQALQAVMAIALRRAAAYALASLLLGGCAQLETRPAREAEVDLAGRLAARYGEESFTGNIAWR